MLTALLRSMVMISLIAGASACGSGGSGDTQAVWDHSDWDSSNWQ